MITRDMLDRWRQQRIQNNARLDYHVPGIAGGRVVMSVEAQKERRITYGERAMKQASEDFRNEQAFKSHEGYAKAQFNHNQSHTTKNEELSP